jgi:large subunit ribosomal protein L29
MTSAELRQKKPEELRALLGQLGREQFNLRMQKGTGQLSRPSRLPEVRREIARIRTLLAQMTAGAAK